MHDTCPTHLIVLHLIALSFGEEYKLQSSLACGLVQPPATSSLLGINILLASRSQTPSVYALPLAWENKFHAHTGQQEIIYLPYANNNNIIFIATILFNIW
jgi:hypothetical protein